MNIKPGKPYTEFRADGWPLCPSCGDDELFSPIMLMWKGEGQRPTVQDCIDDEMACYRCAWKSWTGKDKRIAELEAYIKWLCSVPPPACNNS